MAHFGLSRSLLDGTKIALPFFTAERSFSDLVDSHD